MTTADPPKALRKNENKTQPTDLSPNDFIAGLADPRQRADCAILLARFSAITDWPPQMWGPSIIGFGHYHYRYDSGREGDYFRTGFAPRAKNLTIYIMPGFAPFASLLAELGKHKISQSCLYITKLADIRLDVLERLVIESLSIMRERYG